MSWFYPPNEEKGCIGQTMPNNPWIICPKPVTQPSLRLFCFPYAGGAASIFYPWWKRLPFYVEVCAIQFPGRESRLAEKAFTQAEDLQSPLLEAIHPYLHLPFAFFGHSMGAAVGFELARWLRKQGKPQPVHLFVSGCPAPQLPPREPPLYNLPDGELIQALQRLNGTPAEVLQHSELMELFLPVLRADLTLNDTYTYVAEPPLDCDITAFGGLQDRKVLPEEMAGWRLQTSHSFSLRMFPGDHFFLHSAAELLLQVLSQELSWVAVNLE